MKTIENRITLSATGNGMKSHDKYDTFLELSGGDGNSPYIAEVHLLIRSNDGDFAQGWFDIDVLIAELEGLRQ